MKKSTVFWVTGLCVANFATVTMARDVQNTHTRNAEKSFSPLHDFFKEVEEIFGDDASDDTALRIDNVYSKDMENTFLKIQEAARRLHSEALSAMRALHDTSSQRVCDALKKSQIEMSRGVDNLKGLTAKIDDGISQTQKMAQFSIKEAEKDTVYVVKIALPGYSQENIKVTVNKQDVSMGGKTILEVEARDTQQQKKTVDDKKTIVKVVTQQMVSTSMINDRTRELRYKDGVLQAKLMLPNFVNDESYTMVFKDDVLTLEFEKLGKSEQKKQLMFSK